MRRVGIFGGTFDPVHLGHLLVAAAAMEELGLDRLCWVPAARSPFKPAGDPQPAAVRLRLLRLALCGWERAEVDDQEIRRGGVSYTIDTLRSYGDRFPGAELFYLIGADHVAALPEWKEAEELAHRAIFVVMPRPGASPAAFPPPFRGRQLQGWPLDVSASEIRRRRAAGRPVRHLLPPGVGEVVERESWYGPPPA